MPAMNSRLRKHFSALAASAALAFGAASAEEAPPLVRLETDAGRIDIELYPAKAPQTVRNFLELVDGGFYEGLIFHRVIAGFMIQAGGYDADMKYREPPGTVVNESFNGLSNVAGALAMARTSDPDSAGAQFFINVKDNERLDGAPGRPGYTVFGKVVAGMEAVTDIELRETLTLDGMRDVPAQPVVIHSAKRL